MNHFLISPDAASLAKEAARFIVRVAEEAVAERGRFSVALAGGSTPKATYAELATEPCLSRFPWDKTDWFFGDERAVPPDHADSNYRMAREALLDHVPVDDARIHRMAGESVNLEEAAGSYRDLLVEHLGPSPRIDFILLGIGDDGHTASIFPDVVDQCVGDADVIAIRSAAKGPRITLSLPMINRGRDVAFLVVGPAKQTVLHRIVHEAGGIPAYPAALIQPDDGTLSFLLDEAAAAKLQIG